MGKKVLKYLKENFLTIVSIFVSSFIAFSAYTVSKESQKISVNSGVLRYEIKASMDKNDDLEVTIKPTVGFIRKVSYIKFSDGKVNGVNVSDGTYTENKIEGRISAVSTIPSELMTKRDDKQYVFCLVEGENGTRYLSMVVTRNGKKPIVYDELQTLNDSESPEFNDFRNLRNKLLQDKFIAG